MSKLSVVSFNTKFSDGSSLEKVSLVGDFAEEPIPESHQSTLDRVQQTKDDESLANYRPKKKSLMW